LRLKRFSGDARNRWKVLLLLEAGRGWESSINHSQKRISATNVLSQIKEQIAKIFAVPTFAPVLA